mgnify:CR=1 FL=1
MIIKIKIPDKDPERAFGYFYEKCMDLFILNEIREFEVEVEGTEFKRKRKNEDAPESGILKDDKPTEIEEEDDKLIGYPLGKEED